VDSTAISLVAGSWFTGCQECLEVWHIGQQKNYGMKELPTAGYEAFFNFPLNLAGLKCYLSSLMRMRLELWQAPLEDSLVRSTPMMANSAWHF